jgi:hypothetical protein
MSLTLEYIRNNEPIDQSTIRETLHFFGRQLFELNNGRFYLRQDHYLVDTIGFNLPIQIYQMGNQLYAYLPNSEMQTNVLLVNMIHSNTRPDFTGFAPGRRYNLENGQIWEQIAGITSNCSGGTVLIKDSNLMQVANWNWEIRVHQIQN